MREIKCSYFEINLLPIQTSAMTIKIAPMTPTKNGIIPAISSNMRRPCADFVPHSEKITPMVPMNKSACGMWCKRWVVWMLMLKRKGRRAMRAQTPNV
jgi:hypothetical protein